jgi:hypothetical protein
MEGRIIGDGAYYLHIQKASEEVEADGVYYVPISCLTFSLGIGARRGGIPSNNVTDGARCSCAIKYSPERPK